MRLSYAIHASTGFSSLNAMQSLKEELLKIEHRSAPLDRRYRSMLLRIGPF
jgi:hypothetical protein